MEKILKSILIVCLSSIVYSADELYFSLSEPTIYRDEQRRDLKCVGQNPPKEIYVNFGGVSRFSTGSYYSIQIKDILGAKLVKDENTSIDLVCYDYVSQFVCNYTFGVGEKLAPGEYHFEASEVLSGTPRTSAIREYVSETSFPVSDKIYTPFPLSSFYMTCEFYGDTYDFEVEYKEDVIDPPYFTYDKKEYKCKVSPNDPKKVICPLNKLDFPPSDAGNEYKISFFNVCGQEECSGTIRSVIGQSHETDIFMTYILPTIVLVVVIIAIVVIVVVVKLNKKKGDKDLGEIMATSYASEEDKKKAENPDEGLGQETLA